MSHNGQTLKSNDELTARREFVKQVGKAAVSAPAIALLLASSSRSVAAQYRQPEDPGPRRHPVWPRPQRG